MKVYNISNFSIPKQYNTFNEKKNKLKPMRAHCIHSVMELLQFHMQMVEKWHSLTGNAV